MTQQYVLQSGGRSLVIRTGATPPPAPAGLTATAASSSEVDLAWSGSGTATGFVVQRSTDGSAWATVAILVGASPTSYSDTGLAASTLYYYRVSASGTGGASGFCTPASATTPAAGGLQVLPAFVASAAAKAAAGTAQWAAFKSSQLDGNLSKLINADATYVAGDICPAVLSYALGYRCLAATSASTAHDYADKAVGLIAAAVNAYMGAYSSSSPSYFYRQIATGDGVTAAFTVPNADFVPASVLCKVAQLTTVPIVHGSANGVDNTMTSATPIIGGWDDSGKIYSLFGVKYVTVKFVNATDSASDTLATPTKYALGADFVWYKHYGDAQFQPQRGFGPDWTAGSANQPAPGATYYVRYYDVFGAPNFFSGSGYTLSGTTLTLATPPAAGAGVFAAYIYGTRAGDFSTLSHQTTHADDGGFWSIEADTTYQSRYLFALACALDWLWDYPGFSTSLKGSLMDLLVAWSDHLRDNGYYRGSLASNYGVAGFLFRASVAAALQGRHAAAARLRSEQVAFFPALVAPMLGPPPFHTTPDPGVVGNASDTSFYADTYATLHGGWWPEGYGYGSGSIEDMVLAALVLDGAGWADVSAAKTWAGQVVQALYHTQPTAATQLDWGESDVYPNASYQDYPGVGKVAGQLALYALAALCDDPTQAAYLNHMIQSGTRAATATFEDLMFRDPSATAVDPATAGLPLAYHSDGADIIVSRADWSYASTWAAMDCSRPVPADHQNLAPGNLEIVRGADNLLITGTAYAGYASYEAFGRSLYGNLMAIDDGADGHLVAPWGMSYDTGPGVILKLSELAAAYTYAEIDNRSAWSYPGTHQATNIAVEATRAFLHVRPDYVVVYDRVATTAAKLYPKRVQSYTIARPAVSGQSWAASQGSSKLFGASYSSVPIVVATASTTLNARTMWLTTAVPATARDRWTVVTVYQSAPSAASAMDPSAFVASGDGKLEGVQIGNCVALFVTTSNATIPLPTSYTFTAPAGTTTHLVADVAPGRSCSLSGADQGSATASAAGVLGFTTTGAGTKTVSIS